MDTVNNEMYLEAMAAFSFFNKVLLDAPDREYLSGVKENISLFSEWPFSSSEDSQKGLKLIKEFMEEYNDEVFPVVLDNFNKLFIGPGHLFAPPWESVYKEEDHTIFGQATLEVRRRFRKHGIEINNMHREPDDHIAFECAYLNVLLAEAASAEDDSELKTEILDFIQTHPMSWVEEFTDLMIKNSVTDYCKGIAYMLRGSLREAVDTLSSV